MNVRRVKKSLVEVTMDSSVVKFENTFYVILNDHGKEIDIILRKDWDIETEDTLNLILENEKFIKELSTL